MEKLMQVAASIISVVVLNCRPPTPLPPPQKKKEEEKDRSR